MRRAAITAQPSSLQAEALSAAEFDAAMAAFAPFTHPAIALAVSGGPDSMALALCAKQWATAHNVQLRAFIVDHALRSNSGSEAETTRKQLEKLGILSDILHWQHGPILSKLHMTARKARYKLLLEACHRYGIADLLLAHQREDQAETILMRFAKGSGIDGLAGIAAETRVDKVRLLRPLLAFPKQRLIATCEAALLSYVIDPSNSSDSFARGRLRRVMPLLESEGLTQDRLCDMGLRAAEASEALDHYTKIFIETATLPDEAGTFRVDLESFNTLPRAVAGRVVIHLLQAIHREDYAPEHAALNALLDALRNKKSMTPRTLHGCLVSPTETQLLFMREYAAITDSPTLNRGEHIVWDGRWRITLSSAAPEAFYTVRPLGNPPHDVLDRLAPGLRQKISQGRVRASLPALWTRQTNNLDLALIPSLTTEIGASMACAELVRLSVAGQ